MKKGIVLMMAMLLLLNLGIVGCKKSPEPKVEEEKPTAVKPKVTIEPFKKIEEVEALKDVVIISGGVAEINRERIVVDDGEKKTTAKITEETEFQIGSTDPNKEPVPGKLSEVKPNLGVAVAAIKDGEDLIALTVCYIPEGGK